jgi:glycosyltransferase involved in cell wall biosynthesis
MKVRVASALARFRHGRRHLADVPVSVIINTLDRRDSLERTLVALRDQRYSHFEVVVVDGPSVDGTAEMLRAFEGRARIAACPEANLGLSRNIGLQLAAGDIVAFIDDDAIPPPVWLELLVARYADSHISAAGGPVFDVPLDRLEWQICTCTRLGVPNTDSTGPIERYQGPDADPFAYLAGCNMSFRRSALREIGGFNSVLMYGYDDVDVCCRLIDAGHGIAYDDDAVVRHHRAPSAVRDGRQIIRDPFSICHARAVFTLQCQQLSHTIDEIVETMGDAVQDFRNAAERHFADNEFDEAERSRFVDRARAGTEAGIAAGKQPRRYESIAAPPRDQFLPYR